MERMAWTDERLDDLSNRMDAGFLRVDADMRELGVEVRALRTGMRDEIGALRTTTVRVGLGVGGGIMAGLLGVIATLLARGA